MQRLLLIVVTAMLLAPACGGGSGAGANPSAHACALVRYWADTTGSVADPDSGVTSKSEVLDLARTAWPNDTGTAAQFIQLYNDLSSDLTDAQYAAEASTFTAANC
jgi:hypothetical protein